MEPTVRSTVTLPDALSCGKAKPGCADARRGHRGADEDERKGGGKKFQEKTGDGAEGKPAFAMLPSLFEFAIEHISPESCSRRAALVVAETRGLESIEQHNRAAPQAQTYAAVHHTTTISQDPPPPSALVPLFCYIQVAALSLRLKTRASFS
jgi:hypothetical protein